MYSLGELNLQLRCLERLRSQVTQQKSDISCDAAVKHT